MKVIIMLPVGNLQDEREIHCSLPLFFSEMYTGGGMFLWSRFWQMKYVSQIGIVAVQFLFGPRQDRKYD